MSKVQFEKILFLSKPWNSVVLSVVGGMYAAARHNRAGQLRRATQGRIKDCRGDEAVWHRGLAALIETVGTGAGTATAADRDRIIPGRECGRVLLLAIRASVLLWQQVSGPPH